MNWNLIFKLSLFGLAMAIGTVYFISTSIEPFCWLLVFIICAYLIAKNCVEKYFLHGLMIGIVNSVWVTAAHVLLFDAYVSNHAKEVEMMANTMFSPKTMMLITGPVIGILSGLVLGLFAFVASKIIKKQPA